MYSWRYDGAGLQAAERERLFQSFYTTKEGGMGMGLSLSRAIVEAHGGRLSAAANEPNGAIFRSTLPVAESSTADRNAWIRRPGGTKVLANLYPDIIA